MKSSMHGVGARVTSENEEDKNRQIVELLDVLPTERVESLEPLAVSVGGKYVNGVKGHLEAHPLLRFGVSLEAELVDRIRSNRSPLRELLFYNAIHRRITPLELRIMQLQEPTGFEIRHARDEVGHSSTSAVRPSSFPRSCQGIPNRQRSFRIMRLIKELFDQAPRSLDHFNLSLGPYHLAGNPVEGRDPHPLLVLAKDALPFLVVAIQKEDDPVRELLLYNQIVGRRTAIENAFINFWFPTALEVWHERMRVIAEWRDVPAFKQALELTVEWHAEVPEYGVSHWNGEPRIPVSSTLGDEIEPILDQIVHERIAGDRFMSITLGGYDLAGPRIQRKSHPILQYGKEAIPYILERMINPRDDLRWILIVHAINRQVTRLEAALFRGCRPDYELVVHYSSKLISGIADCREPLGR